MSEPLDPSELAEWLNPEFCIGMLERRGYTVLAPNTPVQFACGWDGRAVGVSEDRKKAQEAVDAAIEQGQVGRWELLERRVAPWTVAKPATGGQFWREQK